MRSMPHITGFAAVREIGLAFPGVEDSACFGQPALAVGGKMFACLPSHRSAEPDSLVVRIDLEQRKALLAEAPEIYYVTAHYLDYTAVLVRLSKIGPDALRGLLAGAIEFVRRNKKRAARRRTALE